MSTEESSANPPPRWWQIEYAATQPFKSLSRYFDAIFYFILLSWVAVVVFLSIVVVGYEYQPLVTPDFNGTHKLWYHSLRIPWIPTAKVCQGSVIIVDGCLSPFQVFLIVALATNQSSGAFGYQVNGFLDPAENVPIDGMMYQNYALQNCSVSLISFNQINQPTTQIQVLIHLVRQTEFREM